MEAFMYRFHPAWVAVRGLIGDGAIGRIIDVGIWFSFRSTRPTDYRHAFHSGGGALYDVGCYAVDTARMLLGDHPDRVLGTARVDPESGIDLTFSGILDYGDAFATFTCSMEQEPQHSVVIHGTAGWLSIADPFNCPADVATTVTIGTGGDHHPHASNAGGCDPRRPPRAGPHCGLDRQHAHHRAPLRRRRGRRTGQVTIQ